jgi:hypothetical protein
MNSHSESGSVSKDTRATRDDHRTNNPRTVRELQDRDIFVVSSKSTR